MTELVHADSTWLDQALNFHIYHASLAPQVSELRNLLYHEVAPVANIQQSPAHTKDALRLILLNLFVGWRLGCPVRYSRNSKDYRHDARYGKLFLKIKRVVPLIDALNALGYIHHARGYFFAADKKQSRMWATDKLAELFEVFSMNTGGLVHQEQPQDIIMLKDTDKIKVRYQDNSYTVGMRNRLTEYNEFIGCQDVQVRLTGESVVKKDYLKSLLTYREYGVCKVSNVINNRIVISNVNYDNNNNTNYSNTNQEHTYITNTIIGLDQFLYGKVDEFESGLTGLTPDCYVEKDKGKKLIEYGLDAINYTINYSYLHRVFNREDSSFSHGGRFFGAYHQRMPSELRANLTINGEQAVELDYKAHHIRMLYHQEHNDYQEDPYDAFGGSKEERKPYKLATLAMVNAPDEKTAVKAIRDLLRGEDGIKFKLTNANIEPLIERFKEVHADISKYLCSDVGCELQNKDSVITDAILTRLTDDGVPCLPVHDSYIVPARHEDLLRQAMVEEYEKVMGYQPQIDRKH
jgi:hypothetical protein